LNFVIHYKRYIMMRYGLMISCFACLLSLTTTKINAQEQAKEKKIYTVFEDKEKQLTGVAVSSSGRVFTNYPRWSPPYQYAVVEVKSKHTATPFPDVNWNTWAGIGNKMEHFLCVQAVVIDDQDYMWVVDAGYSADKTEEDKGQKLVKIDLNTNKVVRVYPLAGATGAKSYMNDTRIDTKQQLAYITNSEEGGIVIVDLQTGAVRQVLYKSTVTTANPAYTVSRLGKPLLRDGAPFHVQSDGIALTTDGKTLYFKALTDNDLYSVSTADLNNKNLLPEELVAKVAHLGKFTTTDGMTIDSEGSLYLGDLEKRQILRIRKDLKVETIIPPTEDFAWPDSYQLTADGWLYVSCSRIDEQPKFHDGKSQRKGPYKIVKIKIK